MTRRSSSLGALLLLAAQTAYAQSGSPIVPEPCRSFTPSDRPQLEARLRTTQGEEQSLGERRTKLLAAGGADQQNSDQVRTVETEIRAKKEALLDLLFSFECFRTDLAPDAALTRGPQETQQWVEVTAYYATNRNVIAGALPSERYGVESAGATEYGRVAVSIPTARRPGDMPLPAVWKFEARPDPSKHFVLKSVTPLTLDGARLEMADKLSRGKKRVLVFVHGYNVGFADAALRTAQLAHDLAFPGVPLFFSWPSAGRTLAYWRDEESIQLAGPAFDAFLDEIAALGASDVYVIGHSMGNRLVATTLTQRAQSGRAISNLRDLLLAAPDINEKLFREQIAPGIAAVRGVRRTIYASSGDLALRASKIVHSYRRVGETAGGPLVFAGFETIDASATASTLRAFGHSYVVDSRKVLGDIQDLITLRFGADRRRLLRNGAPPDAYWILR